MLSVEYNHHKKIRQLLQIMNRILIKAIFQDSVTLKSLKLRKALLRQKTYFISQL